MNDKTILLILKIVDLLALGMTLAPVVKKKFDNARDELRVMVEQGKDPKPGDFARITAELEAVQAVLEGRSAELSVDDGNTDDE